jgi:hypothetical protein
MRRQGVGTRLSPSSFLTGVPDMLIKLLGAAASLAVAGAAAQAEADGPVEGTPWVLLFLGLVAIGLYAVTRTYRD